MRDQDPEKPALEIARLGRELAEAQSEIEELRSLVERSQDAILSIDSDGVLLSMNAAASSIFVCHEELDDEVRFWDCLEAESAEEFRGALDRLKPGQALRSELRLPVHGVGPEFVEAGTTRLDDGRIQIIARDVSDRLQRERRARSADQRDALTQLPNRQLFMTRCEATLALADRRGGHVALMVVDIDEFARLNDEHGCERGDAVLREVARRLGDRIRQSDCLGRSEPLFGADTVSRLGGDEFTLLLSDIRDTEDAARVARRVISLLRSPHVHEGRELSCQASIGIAVFPEDGIEAEVLLRRAEAALHHAKKRGGGYYEFHTQAMSDRVDRRLRLEKALGGALDRGELSLELSPMIRRGVDGVDQAIAFSARPRWRLEGGPAVDHGDLWPLLEQSARGSEIIEWSLGEACRLASELTREGVEIAASVRVSGAMLRDEAFVDRVADLLRRVGASPDQLQLEFSEDTLGGMNSRCRETLRELDEAGYGLCLVDFGSGRSSIAALRSCPLDRLRIDRSFSADVCASPADVVLVSGIIGLAHGLGVDVVADGVDSPEQLSLLAGRGCDCFQGAALGEGSDEAALRRWLRSSGPASEAP